MRIWYSIILGSFAGGLCEPSGSHAVTGLFSFSMIIGILSLTSMNYSAMVSIVVSIVLFPLVPALHIAARRTRRGGLLGAIVAYLGVWVAAGWRFRGGELFTVDYILAGIGTIGFLVLGYLEFYSMLCRGFSLQLLVDVYRRGSSRQEEIIAQYGGKGIDWMFKKRVATMQALNMVGYDGKILILKRPRGAFVGKLGLMVKHVLKMGVGG